VRRNVVDERYARLIEAMYQGRDTIHVATEVTFEDGRKGRIEAEIAIRDTMAAAQLRQAA
jgi:long-chain acyl-CoA synthetase